MQKKIKTIGICGLIGAALLFLLNFEKVQAMLEEDYEPLSGVVIVLDPGHGGIDDGAQKAGISEQSINLSISQKLKEKLEGAGAKVVLTRDGDYDLAMEEATNRKRDDMKNRVALINAEPSDLFLSVHLNSYPNTSVHGGQVFYRANDEGSKQLAQIIQDQLNSLLNQKKTVKTGDFYILNNTTRPGVLVECGYLSNAEEREKLSTDEYQETLSKVLYDSLISYFEALNL